jgi:hypothetical protein
MAVGVAAHLGGGEVGDDQPVVAHLGLAAHGVAAGAGHEAAVVGEAQPDAGPGTSGRLWPFSVTAVERKSRPPGVVRPLIGPGRGGRIAAGGQQKDYETGEGRFRAHAFFDDRAGGAVPWH